ncbi:MAG: hypothetical protein VX278_19235 [Myxococcota bacterium]|nr:hypothetical protein [Myxococcota bacterium]
MKKITFILSLTLLSACPDPIESSNNTAEQKEVVMENNGPSQMESDPNAARLNLKDGEGLTVQGSFKYTGTATGSKRVDVQKHRDGAAPSLVHTLEIQDDNSFSFQVPPDYGKILITGFVDKDGNGPTSDDPQGRLSLEVGAEAISDVVLEVSDDYTPAAPPGGGQPNAEGQPGEGQPGEGQPGEGQPQPGQPGQPQPGQPGEAPMQPGEVQPGQPPADTNPGVTPAPQGGSNGGNAPKQQDGPPADE